MDIATLPDSQPIAGMRRFRDAAGEVVFDYVLGNGPLVLSAPHAGWRTYEPTGVNAFGGREGNDPGDEPTALNRGRSMGPGGFNDSAGDFGTRYITFGIARYLVSRGVRPHVIMARQRRNVVDLNRPWGFQHHWELDPPGINLPNLITTPDGIDPEFLRTYYLAYHQVLLSMVRRAARGPEGWLFDIHGEAGNDSFRLATHRGITARADALYDGPQCLRALVDGAGLSVTPNTVTAEASGFSYIAGFLHGATLPSRLGAPTDPPVPPPGRLHGVHVEIARSYRLPPGATDFNYMNHITTADIEWLEAIGAQFGEGLYAFVNGRGLV
jgi:hypothetical protein